MAVQDIFIDVSRGAFVAGLDSTTLVAIPPLVRGTTPTLHVYLLAQTAGWPNATPPYSFIPVAGLTLEMAVGMFGGTSYLASVFAWTASADPADPYFEGTLNLNTSIIASALGSARQITAVMQVDSLDSTGTPTDILLSNVTLKNAIILQFSGTDMWLAVGEGVLLSNSSGDIRQLTCDSLGSFSDLPYTGAVPGANLVIPAGNGIVLVSASGVLMNRLIVDVGGSFSALPVSIVTTGDTVLLPGQALGLLNSAGTLGIRLWTDALGSFQETPSTP
jgi:hypothetical protein